MMIGDRSDGLWSAVVMGFVRYRDVRMLRSHSRTRRNLVLAIAMICVLTVMSTDLTFAQTPNIGAKLPLDTATSAAADSPLAKEALEVLEILQGARKDLTIQRKALIERLTKLEEKAAERSGSEPQPATDRQVAGIAELESEIADLNRQMSETATIETRSNAISRYLDRHDQLTTVPYFADGFDTAVLVRQTQKDVEMHQGPDRRWPVVGKIRSESLVVVLARETDGDWRLVATEEHYGYVRQKDLSEVRQ